MVLGTARLATALMHGATPADLAAQISNHDTHPAARLFDAAAAFHLIGQGAPAAALQQQALQGCTVFRVRQDAGHAPALRVLALVLPGDMMVNLPLDFLTNHLDVQLDLLVLAPDQALPAELPEHDVMVCAGSEQDPESLARMQALFRAWPLPAINDPSLLPNLARDRLPVVLDGAAGVHVPASRILSSAVLEQLAAGRRRVDAWLPGGDFPVLLRPLGSHAGTGLVKLDSPDALAAHLAAEGGSEWVVTPFVDYSGTDGLFRKYRVAFVDGRAHLCHMAVSSRWMVHYLNAGMTESADKRAEEAAAMETFDAGFARRHADAFAALCARLKFDYFSIDCAELPDGRLLVFEADTVALVHMMDPIEMFPYKHVHMRRVCEDVGRLLHDRAGRAQ